MSFVIPKCPVLVVCAMVICFMSKVDPNNYFLPSILFKEREYGDSDDDASKTVFVSGNNDDDANGGWNNKHLRIGAQENNNNNNNSKHEVSNKLEKFAKAAKPNDARKNVNLKKSGKKQDKKPEEIANILSSRKNTEVVEVVVEKNVSEEKKTLKNTANGGMQQQQQQQQQQQAAKKPKDSQSIARKKTPERTDKPLFILHIGPPKTGTTTLQCELGEKFQELREENFYYLGTYYAPLCGLPRDHVIEGFADATRPVLLHCYAEHANKDCDLEQQWLEFEEIIVSHKDHNVIMSDEMFHHHFEEEDVTRFAKILNQHWDVRIMYTYRHFYSSLPSMYRQLNDPYATQKGMAYAYEKTIWPEDGGYKIQSFRDGNYFKVTDEMRRFQLWTASFDWVEVFNMHNTNGADYLPAFLCTMIPESKALCQDAKKNPASNHKDNDSSSKFLYYDMLAVEGHEQGLLQKSKKTREEVRDAVQDFCKSKDWEFTHFPLDCLTEIELSSFLSESLEQATILQPYFANPRDDSRNVSIEEEIESGFHEYQQNKKFCSVNTKRTLEEHPWRQFFLNLE
ncbi:MAG: hypothetical protein SGBAC_010462 [Bacillariaceae sp.]